MVLCGEGSAIGFAGRTHLSMPALVLSAVFCAVTLLAVAFNYRDFRTKYALGLIIAGSACILYSVALAGGELLYYSGVGLVFLGVWLNASLLYVLALILQPAQRLLLVMNRSRNRVAQKRFSQHQNSHSL
jgi:hypothetical protein